MRASKDIVKAIKDKHFPNLESQEYKDLTLELHQALTWERNTKVVEPVVPKVLEKPKSK